MQIKAPRLSVRVASLMSERGLCSKGCVRASAIEGLVNGEDLRQVSEFVVLKRLVDRVHCMYVPKHVDLSQMTTSFVESEGRPPTPPSRAIGRMDTAKVQHGKKVYGSAIPDRFGRAWWELGS